MKQSSPERWAIVLAGGEGSRLRSFTKALTGHELPKQFCPLMGPKPLLRQTLDRISGTVAPSRTIISLNREHEPFYASIVSGARGLLAEQPCNRGTAPAILHALMRGCEDAPSAVVGLFPSDHYVSDDGVFMRHVAAAFDAAEQSDEAVVLLGVEATSPEQGYGWVEPGGPLGLAGHALFSVRRFVEKPDRDLAEALWRGGALWNTFVLIGGVTTLLRMFIIALPRLYARFSAVRATLGTVFEESVLTRLYADLPALCFSESVLQRCAANLAVLPVHGVEWCDLGEPARVMRTVRQAGICPQWAAG